MAIRHSTGGGAGDGDITLIETITLAADAGSITFSSIPQIYGDLWIVGKLRTDDAVDSTDILYARMGGTAVDTGASDYNYHSLLDGGDGGSSVTNHAAAFLSLGVIPGTTGADAGTLSAIDFKLFDYTDAGGDDHHGLVKIGGIWASGKYRQYSTAIVHKSKSEAIDVIQFYSGGANDIEAGSRLSLYGIGSPL